VFLIAVALLIAWRSGKEEPSDEHAAEQLSAAKMISK
jgi:hypothetical protein